MAKKAKEEKEKKVGKKKSEKKASVAESAIKESVPGEIEEESSSSDEDEATEEDSTSDEESGDDAPSEEAKQEEQKKSQKKEKKVIYLKQWMVSGTTEAGKEAIEFYLATCGLKAREFYKKRNGESSKIHLVMQTAESSLEAKWLEDHDPYQWTMKK